MKSIAAEDRALKFAQYVVSGIVFVIVAVPLYISIMGGFKSVGQLRAQPVALPHPFIWSQYADMLTGVRGSFWLEL